MPINPKHTASLTYIDYSDEDTTTEVNVGPITALTIVAFLAQFGDFRTATNAITLGNLANDRWTGDATKYNVTPPTDANAQRERKFQVNYQDTTTFAQYRLEIGTADLEGRMIAGTDFVDLTNTEIAAWITAFETLCKSPEGNGVNVLNIVAVGRNN